MRTVVMALTGPGHGGTDLRCEAFAGFLSRLHAAEPDADPAAAAALDPAAALDRLAGEAWLMVEGDEVRYVPSRQARTLVATRTDRAWPATVASRHSKAVRTSAGVVYRFPLEPATGGPTPDGEYVETFVTDWTGLPSACAIALHPAHPLSTGLSAGQDAAFTGRFCRHPLTGDLLPLWVATWVKADFGTGAVLLNPGHNRPDLEFCRKVGLPVRFSLLAAGHDGTPASWLVPPFIKQGEAVRSGFADGKSFDEAKNVYLQAVSSWGLAEAGSDYGFGSLPVARLAGPDAGDGLVEAAWHTGRGALTGGAGADRVRLAAVSPVVLAADPEVRRSRLTVVVPSAGVDTDLLALRALLAEPRLGETGGPAPEVVVVGAATALTEPAAEDVTALAMLVSAGPLDTVALKAQHIEPCERFLKVHEALAFTDAVADGEPSAETAKVARKIKNLLRARDPKQAFTQLYRLQKTLAKSEAAAEPDVLVYAALAGVLAGTGSRFPAEAVAGAWAQI
ncbi:MAG: hypothetical protein ACJ786_31875 [Catenulispora sp.]